MFEDCTQMNYGPNLSAVTALGTECCKSMFKGCIELYTTPSLNVTTLVQSCYESMFEGCISLINMPNLPATSLAQSCYASMFKGCTGITSITSNAFPATTLAQ